MTLRSRPMLVILLTVSALVASVLWWSIAGHATDPARATRVDADPTPVLAATAAEPEDDPANPASPDPATPGGYPPTSAAPVADPLDAQSAMLPMPLEGVRLARQSLKRGGLGSKVRGTFTVRNRNDFAIKDVEIECAFRGRNGYTTQRRRVLPDTIEPRSRETFSNVLVGHINVTTTRGKCRLAGASRA